MYYDLVSVILSSNEDVIIAVFRRYFSILFSWSQSIDYLYEVLYPFESSFMYNAEELHDEQYQ